MKNARLGIDFCVPRASIAFDEVRSRMAITGFGYQYRGVASALRTAHAMLEPQKSRAYSTMIESVVALSPTPIARMYTTQTTTTNYQFQFLVPGPNTGGFHTSFSASIPRRRLTIPFFRSRSRASSYSLTTASVSTITCWFL